MLNLLVVDDDEAWRLTLKDWLARKNVQVVGCSHGDWAITAIQTHRPDVVMLDVHLPGRSGLDVLRSVRHRWPALPVIVTTAFGGAESEEAATSLGASAYLAKPFRMERLFTVLRRLLGAPDGQRTAGTS